MSVITLVRDAGYHLHLLPRAEYNPALKNYEIAYYNKAMAGVSGDFYDFYYNNTSLEGFGIFDVSGHGLASGLVTMLAKNIIEEEEDDAELFRKTFGLVLYRIENTLYCVNHNQCFALLLTIDNQWVVTDYDEVPFRPDWLLRDLVKILHPDLLPNHTLRYYSPLKQD